MLSTRILTAILLLAVLLPALWSPLAWPFAAVILLLVSLASWEWARLNAASPVVSFVLVAILIAVVALTWWQVDAVVRFCLPYSGWVLAAWVVGGALVLRQGPSSWKTLIPGVRWILGLAVLWVAWLAFIQAKTMGLNFVLSVFCLVWISDIAAYAGGRFWGQRKLAPSISPGKSWEGVFSAVVAVQVWAPFWSLVLDRYLPVDTPSLYALLYRHWGVGGGCLALAALTGMGVAGDLIESLVKRSAGAKDSSALLPGHGGVLDRIDSLLPVFPMALALVSR